MSRSTPHLLFALVLLAASVASCPAAEDQTLYQLHRDPFAAATILPPAMASATGPNQEAPTVSFALRATLVAKRQSLANINGSIVMLGDEIEGYRLREVGEEKVVLEKDGKQLTVVLDQ